MNMHEWLQTILLFVVLLVLLKPLDGFMAKAYQGERAFLSPLLAPCERMIYRICGVEPEDEMGWQRYAASMLLLNLAFPPVSALCQPTRGRSPSGWLWSF